MRSSSGPSKLYVGDLGDNRKADLTRLFSKYGEILTIYIDEHKHFAFIEFSSPTDAQRALEKTNNKTVNGSKLRVEFARTEKPSRTDHHRRLSPRDRSPTAALYSHLQVTANRLPPMQVFRQSYYQHHPSSHISNGHSNSISRGRSLTPPSFKHNPRLPPMPHLHPPDFYYSSPPTNHHSSIYSDTNSYRNYPDPYLVQRLPSSTFTSTKNSSRSSHRNISSTDFHCSSSRSHHHRRSRSRSRHRTSPSSRRSRKQKRRSSSSSSVSSSSSQPRERGPRTPSPPPPPSEKKSSKKRSREGSNAVSSASEQKSSLHSSSEDEQKQSNSKKPIEAESNRKHSKRKDRE